MTKPSRRLTMTLQVEADRAMMADTFDVDEFAEEIAEAARAVFIAQRRIRIARDIEAERNGTRPVLVQLDGGDDSDG